MRFRLGGNLWHHSDFIRFWTGDTVTQFTGQVTSLALPTIAVLTLNVSGFQLGLLSALSFIAFPVLGLFVGVWMDRMRRRPVMIAVNLVRLVTLASIPLAFITGVLSLYQLYVIALIMGICTLFFDVAYQSYLPSLVERENVVEGNQKLQISASGAQVVGPSIASLLMGLIGAAMSILVDVMGFFVSVVMLFSIRKPEPAPKADSADGGRHFFGEMKEGIRVITGNSLLWSQAGCTATQNLGTNMYFVALLLYAYRILGISKSVIGFAFSLGALGFLLGVLASTALTKRLGLGRTIALSTALNLGLLLVLLPMGNLSLLIIGLALFVSNVGIPIYNINQVSLRQIITPDRLQGRMNATMRTIVWGTIPAGSLIGGILTTLIGIIPTLLAGAIVGGGSILWILLGPIIRLRKQPEPVDGES
ncbi:MAG: MFS transporter [Nitrososphaerota archaeon]|jgi:MFS family permease|nr:MFS transporter [Nitrososphaerota archaeon]